MSARTQTPVSTAPDHGWIERAETALAEAGHKRGGARRAVLELLDAQTCALTAVEIESALIGGERRVSRASVYRILDELEGLRLVQRVETGQAMVRYERVCAHDEHHHLDVGSEFAFADMNPEDPQNPWRYWLKQSGDTLYEIAQWVPFHQVFCRFTKNP